MDLHNHQSLRDNLDNLIESHEALKTSLAVAQAEVTRISEVAEGLEEEKRDLDRMLATSERELTKSKVEQDVLKERVTELEGKLKDAAAARWEVFEATDGRADPTRFLRTSYYICPDSGDLTTEVRSETKCSRFGEPFWALEEFEDKSITIPRKAGPRWLAAEQVGVKRKASANGVVTGPPKRARLQYNFAI